MSEYNKTILTNAGIDLARRANKGVATFQLTRGVSSTENLSEKTIEELQNLTQLPSVQQSVILSDVVNTTDNPDTVLGIRMTFDNQNLKTGYNVHTVGVYAKEPGKGEILYGVATAKTPEYIPDFGEQTLFKFDFLMYLVIGRADKVTVEVSPDDVYRKKDTYNKAEIDAKVSDAVSQLNNKDAEIIKNLNDYKQENNTYHQNFEQQTSAKFATKADKTTVEQQLGTKADKSTTYTKDEVDNRISPKADKNYVDGELSKKADKATTYTKDEVNSKIAGQVKSVNGHRADSNGEVTLPKLKAKTLVNYDVKNKAATFDENAGFDGNGNFSHWPVDQWVVSQLADAINAKLPIEAGAANADLLLNSGNKIVYWNGNGGGVKNLPPMNNKQWFFAVKLFDPGWGSVTVIDQDGTYWLNTKNGDIWTGWRSVITNEHLKKLKFVKQSVNQNGDTFINTQFVTQEADGTFKINIYDSDWTANKVSWLLKNTKSYNIGANANLNDIKAPGLYHCSGASNIANVPDSRDSWFNMVVNSDNWNGSQVFYATNDNQFYIRTWNNSGFKQWRRVINDEDYNNLLTSKADKATTYTKDEVNGKIAGQVKSVNGHIADSNGEVTLPKLKAKTLVNYDVKNKAATFDENAGFDGNGNFSHWPVDQWVVSQLADAINAKLPIEAGAADDDLCHLTSSKISFWDGNGENVKNLPPMSNKRWYFAIRLAGPGGWGSVTVVDQDGTYWLNTKNGDIWAGWRSVTTNETLKKLKFVKQSLNQNGETFQDTKFVTQEPDGTFKINIYDSDWTAQKVSWLLKNTYTKSDVDSKLSGKANTSDVNARLPLSGGSMNKGSYVMWNTESPYNAHDGDIGGLYWNAASDSIKIFGDNNGSDNLDLAIQLGDDNSNHISFRDKDGVEHAAISAYGHFTGSTDWAGVAGTGINNPTLFKLLTSSNTWYDIIGEDNGRAALAAFRDQSNGSGNTIGNFSSGIVFGGGDTKGALNVAYDKPQARIIGGNGTKPVWSKDVAWKDDLKVTVVRNYDVANNHETQHGVENLNAQWLVDQSALSPFAEAINALNTNLSTLRTELMNLKRRVDYNSPQGEFNNTTVNIDNFRNTGIYRLANCYIQNGPYPTNNAHWVYVKVTVFDANTVYQTLYEGDNMYGRKSSSPTNWGKWHKYLNQEV